MTNTIGKVVADFETQLSTVLAVGGTSATLQSCLDDDGVVLPNGYYYLTLDRKNSTKEYIICLLTVTLGVGYLTAINSVSRQGVVGSSGTKQKHRVGASVTLTDFATLLELGGMVGGSLGLLSASPMFYDANFTPTVGQFQVATWDYIKNYVDTVAVSGAPDANTSVKGISQLTAAPAKVIGNPTISIASPGVITLANHGMVLNNTVKFSTSGALPTGITAGTVYYVISAGLTSSTFRIATTQGGTAINTTGSQSGTHTLTDVTPRAMGESDARFGTASSLNVVETADDASNGVDQSQLTQNASTTVGMADSTTNQNKLAQSFIAGKTSSTGAILNKQADTGTFTGTVTVSLQADSSGSPSGTPLATVTLSNATWLAIPAGAFAAIFGTPYTTIQGVTYWIVVETSTADNSNHPNIGTNSAGGYASGSIKYRNVTDGWVAIATIDLYFEALCTTSSKLVKYTSNGFIPASYAVDVGSTDAYYIVARGVTSYIEGQTFKVKCPTANTGPATLNINSLGAIAIVKNLSTALDTGDILANQIIEVIYNSTGGVFQLKTTPANIINSILPVQTDFIGGGGSLSMGPSSSGSSAEITVGTGMTIAAGKLGPNSGIKISLNGISLGVGGDVFGASCLINVKFNGTTIASWNQSAKISQFGDAIIFMLNQGATNSQKYSGTCKTVMNTFSNNGWGGASIIAGTSSIDFSISQAITVTMTFFLTSGTGSSNANFSLNSTVVELVN